ncbi:hypothetical protein [Nitrosomonas oligotropha]|uniref:hypothetical protein n=1 Tax=Nitrosomonas oligotropha TaxID=42354 RepID=UPI001F037828|nr:hypothetical protein [Nitrosomonas oligotropha]
MAMLKPSISMPVSNTVRWNPPGRFLLGCFLGGLPGSLPLRAAAVRLRLGFGFTVAGWGLPERGALSIEMGIEQDAPHRGNGWMNGVADDIAPSLKRSDAASAHD